MKLKVTLFFFLLIGAASSAFAVDVTGDYRSNVTTTGLWNVPGNWEVYNGTIWVTASSSPNSTNGVITIVAGDSIRLNNVETIDQVVIAAGGVLSIFNTSGTVTINDDASGDDIIVNGRLYVALGTTVNGTGTIHNTSAGLMTLRNGGILGAPVTNDGIFNIGSSTTPGGTINGTLTNNNSIVWIEGNGGVGTGGNIQNNGTFTISNTATVNVIGNGTITNPGIIVKNSTASFNIIPVVLNTGTINGIGAFTFGTITNTGTIAPGSSPGILSVSPEALNGNTPTLAIELVSSLVAGTGYDRLDVSGAGSVNLSTSKLKIIDNGAAPLGTYTILTTTGTATFTGGAFAAGSTIPSNFGAPVITANSVTIEKLSVLPVIWGPFTALAKNNQVALNWSTLLESNTREFVVEYGTDGHNFASIGSLNAQGNSSITAAYAFTHTSPSLNKTNYYRLKQIDLDGKSTYSAIRSVGFINGKVIAVTANPNPVKASMLISVQEKNLTITLTNINGAEVRRWKLEPGTYPMNLQDLSAGTYQLNVYDKVQKIQGQRIIKL